MLATLLVALIAAPPASVLVLPVEKPAGATTVDAALWTEELRAAVAKLPGHAPIPGTRTDEAVAGARALGVGCAATSRSCALQMGGLSGAAYVVVTVATDESGAILLEATKSDVVAMKHSQGVRVRVPVGASAAERGRALDLLAVRLLAPELERGRITIRTQPPGAAVLVDKIGRATTPRTVEVLPGRHEVIVGRVGFEGQTHTVDVDLGEDEVLDLTLVAAPDDVASPLPFALDDPPPPAALAPEAPAKKKALRVALHEVKAPEFPARVPRLVGSALLLELRKLQGLSVVSFDELRAILDFEASRQLAGCESDSACLADVAGALGVDLLVTVELDVIDDTTTNFNATVLDQHSAATRARVSQPLKAAGGEELLAAVGPVVEELFPSQPLRPGVERGASKELALRLNPPPLRPWVFWSTVGATSVLAAATATVGAVNLATSSTPLETNRGAEVKARDDIVRATGTAFWVGVGATALLAAGVGVEALFVDWWGYGEEGKP